MCNLGVMHACMHASLGAYACMHHDVEVQITAEHNLCCNHFMEVLP
jgi:hypothetical protein